MRRPPARSEQPIPPIRRGTFWLRPDATPGATVVAGVPITQSFGQTIAPIITKDRFAPLGPPQPVLSLAATIGVTTRHPKLDVAGVSGNTVSVVNRWSSEWNHAVTLPAGSLVHPFSVDGSFAAPQRWAKASVKEPFTLPAIGETVEVTLTSTDWLVAGRGVGFWRRTVGFWGGDSTDYGVQDETSGIIEEILDEERFLLRYRGRQVLPADFDNPDEMVYGDAEEGDVIAAATAVGPWTASNWVGGGYGIEIGLSEITLEVASSDWFSVGDVIAIRGYNLGSLPLYILISVCYRTILDIPDSTHIVFRRLHNAWPYPSNPSGHLWHIFPARLWASSPGPRQLPFAHVLDNTSFPASGSTVTLEVSSTAWMVPDMKLRVAGRVTRTASVVEVIDESHVLLLHTVEPPLSSSVGTTQDDLWGALITPYTHTTADVQFPLVDETADLPVEDASWIAAVEVPDVSIRPVWTGQPVQQARVAPCFLINGRWIASADLTFGGCLWRFDGATGLRKWKMDWAPPLSGGDLTHTFSSSNGAGISNIVTDGTMIFALGARASLTGESADAYNVRCYDGDGQVVWQTDIGAVTGAVLSLVEDVGVVIGHAAFTIGSEKKMFTCLDPDTGEILWRINPEGTSANGSGGYAVRFNGALTMGHTAASNGNHHLFTYDDDGTLQGLFASPVAAGGLATTTNYLFTPGERYDAGGVKTNLPAGYTAAPDADGETVWVTHATNGKSQLDAATLAVLQAIPGTSGDLAVLPDGYAVGYQRFDSNLDRLWRLTDFTTGQRTRAFQSDVLMAHGSRVTLAGNALPG